MIKSQMKEEAEKILDPKNWEVDFSYREFKYYSYYNLMNYTLYIFQNKKLFVYKRSHADSFGRSLSPEDVQGILNYTNFVLGNDIKKGFTSSQAKTEGYFLTSHEARRNILNTIQEANCFLFKPHEFSSLLSDLSQKNDTIEEPASEGWKSIAVRHSGIGGVGHQLG